MPSARTILLSAAAAILAAAGLFGLWIALTLASFAGNADAEGVAPHAGSALAAGYALEVGLFAAAGLAAFGAALVCGYGAVKSLKARR